MPISYFTRAAIAVGVMAVLCTGFSISDAELRGAKLTLVRGAGIEDDCIWDAKSDLCNQSIGCYGAVPLNPGDCGGRDCNGCCSKTDGTKKQFQYSAESGGKPFKKLQDYDDCGLFYDVSQMTCTYVPNPGGNVCKCIFVGPPQGGPCIMYHVQLYDCPTGQGM